MAQLVLPLTTRPALGREDFVVAPGNAEAVAFLDSFPDWPAPAAVALWPRGIRKIASRQRMGRAFAGADVEAVALDGHWRLHGYPVVIENIDAAKPDAARDAVLFALLERGGPVLFTGREKPSQWQATLPDLMSRYRALLSFALWQPDDALLEAIARKLFADKQLSVPDAVIAQMIRSLERSPSVIREFVARVDVKALSEKRPITTALIREILPD